ELLGLESADRVEEGRLHAREGEVEAAHAGHRKGERVRVAFLRQPVEGGAARIAESEQSGALVERLAGGVVEGRAGDPETARLAHLQQERVPSRRQQTEEGRLDGLGLEKQGGDVAVEVVDRCEREPPPPGERLGRGEPNEESADQARALRGSDELDLV